MRRVVGLASPSFALANCASCHGEDGNGGPAKAGYFAAMPNFTDCGFAPHYTSIRSADEVQIYEAMLGDPRGAASGPLEGYSASEPQRYVA